MSGTRTPATPGSSRLARVGVRLLQFSPILVLAVAAAVWFALPAFVRGTALAPAPTPSPGWDMPFEYDRYDAAIGAFESYDSFSSSESGVYHVRETERLHRDLEMAARYSWSNLREDPESLFGDTGVKPLPAEPDSPAFEPVSVFEREYGARVTLWVAPGAVAPRMVLSSSQEHPLLTAEERAELEQEGTLESLRRAMNTMSYSPMPLALPNNHLSGMDDSMRSIEFILAEGDDRVWEVYLLGKPVPVDDIPVSLDPFNNPFSGTDPTTPAGRSQLLQAAEDFAFDLYVIGPVDGEPIPLRVPRSVDTSLIDEVWPQRLALGDAWHFAPETFALSARERAAAADGRWGVLVTIDAGSVGWSPGSGPQAAPQVIVALASFRQHPSWAAVSRDPDVSVWRRAQIVMAANYRFVLGSLSALALLALVTSPLSFAWDLRQRTERELAEQRERIQVQSHERVAARLTALASRVDAEAAAASNDMRRHLSTVAHDIEDTLSDLRRILDDPHRAEGDSDE